MRLVCGVALSFAPLFLRSWAALGLVLAIGLLLAAAARLPARQWFSRIVTANAFVLMLALTVPWSMPGDALVIVGGFEYTHEGAEWAARTALRANAVLVALSAFLGTMEPMTIGHAMQRLGVPNKLALLLMFTVRYIEVFEREYLRLRQAMRVRGFQARANAHTLRTFGHLVGMLLVHAFDRSERIQQAMRCRGFAGTFHTHRHMRTRAGDWAFAASLVVALASAGWLEWV